MPEIISPDLLWSGGQFTPGLSLLIDDGGIQDIINLRLV